MAFSYRSFNFDDTELRSLFMDKEEREKVLKAMKEREAKKSNKDSKDEGGTDCENEMKVKKSSEDANVNGKSASDKEGDQDSSGELEAEPRIEWSVGDYCRAMYSEDLMFYEAIITKIVDEDTFMIKFLGYDTEELEKREYMLQSKGRVAQQKQQLDAASEFEVGGFCRALYKDNKWYEAILVRFVVINEGSEEEEDDGYVVKFLGYEGESHVYEVRPSWGPRARQLQETVAKAHQEDLSSVGEDSDEDNYEDIVSMYESGSELESGATVSEKQGHGKHSSKRSTHYLPRTGCNISIRSARDQASSNRHGLNPCCSTWEPQSERRIGGPCASIIPPSTCRCSNTEDQALDMLLMSWYMAGYNAGTNEGRLSRHRRTCCSCGH